MLEWFDRSVCKRQPAKRSCEAKNQFDFQAASNTPYKKTAQTQNHSILHLGDCHGFKFNAIQSKRHFQAAVKRAARFVVALRAAVVGAAVELFVKQVVHAQAQVYIVVEAVARADAHQAVRFHRFAR